MQQLHNDFNRNTEDEKIVWKPTKNYREIYNDYHYSSDSSNSHTSEDEQPTYKKHRKSMSVVSDVPKKQYKKSSKLNNEKKFKKTKNNTKAS